MNISQSFKSTTYTPNSFYDYLKLIEDGLSADLSISALVPATLGSSEVTVLADIAGSAEKFVRTVTATLKNANGDILTWFNGTLPLAVAETTAGDGTAAIEDSASVITFVNGVGTANIEYIGVWAEADTCTVTISASNAGEILGNAITAKTSVDTLIA